MGMTIKEGAGMTNGEKMKQIFPSLKIDEGELYVYLWLPCHDAIDIPLEWWNAEYKEPNCSEIPTGSTAKIDVPDNNVGDMDCISRSDAIHAVSEALKHTFVEHEDIANKVIGKLPSVTPQEPRCKDCKWWKDSDGEYRRGCGAESRCPINRREVFEGNGYCYLFEPQESENKE